MTLKFRVRNVEAVQSFLRAMPRGTIRVAVKAFAEYILGNERRGLRHADPYKFVTRKSAYGSVSKDGAPDGYFSWRQFKYVAWKTRGFTKNMKSANNRTGKSTAAWKAEPRNSGYAYTLLNDTAGGYYTRHDTRQARQLGKVGWRKTSAVIAANYLGGIKAAIAAVKIYLATKK